MAIKNEDGVYPCKVCGEVYPKIIQTEDMVDCRWWEPPTKKMWHVSCPSIHCDFCTNSGHFERREDAINAWNRKMDDSQDNTVNPKARKAQL